MELNCQQKLAVEHLDGPLLILAGAGSGKTRVLTERIVHLIRNFKVSPWKILAVTFTNKAAGEMRERVEKHIGSDARSLWISTFHSACVRMLRKNAEKAGLPPHFSILGDSDQMSLAREALKELNIGEKLVTPRSLVEKISRAKDSLVSPEEYPSGDFYNSKISSAYLLYNEKLRKNGSADFGDLIMLTVKLFHGYPAVLQEYQKRFQYIMVDEYQDTNHAQYELVRLLAGGHKNICVVGDPDQSVYGWRGADIRNILQFERDFPGAKVIKLEQNYRSTKNILSAADAVVENNKSRKPKKLWTENDDGELVNIIETEDEREEAKRVAEEIKKLTDSGTKASDIAVFYRTNAQSRVFEDELRKAGIPYIIFGGIRFYDRAEIKNVIAYLRLIVNPSDDVSVKRIINIPARGIGKATVDKLGAPTLDFIKNRLSPAEFNSGQRQKLFQFSQLIAGLAKLSELPLPQLVNEVVNKSGYASSLAAEKTEEALERLANIDEFISAVSEAYKENPSLTLPEFLDQVSLVSDIDRHDANVEVLPMMTLHLAKGLEFSHVFIVGLEEGLLPHARAINCKRATGFASASERSMGENGEFDEAGCSPHLEEERRLFYVGMTRAEKTLYLCHAKERMVRGSFNYNIKSRFLEEIPEELVSQPACHCEESRQMSGRRGNPLYTMNDFNQFEPEEDVGIIKVGQRVKHKLFGEGIVCKAEGKRENQKVYVRFRNGELKRLAVQYANLVVL